MHIWVEMNTEYVGSSLLLTRQDRQRSKLRALPPVDFHWIIFLFQNFQYENMKIPFQF